MSARFEAALSDVLLNLFEFLAEKNKKYGNSALEPVRLFSKASPDEQIKVRIDDKLSRIRTAAPGDEEDAVKDLMGYLILLEVHKELHRGSQPQATISP